MVAASFYSDPQGLLGGIPLEQPVNEQIKITFSCFWAMFIFLYMMDLNISPHYQSRILREAEEMHRKEIPLPPRKTPSVLGFDLPANSFIFLHTWLIYRSTLPGQ